MGVLNCCLVVLVSISIDIVSARQGCASADPPLCGQYADDKERYCGREYIKNNCLNLCGRCSCPALDPVFCDIYASKPKYYCQHSWIKNRCKILCGICDTTAVTSLPPLTGRPPITGRPPVTDRPPVTSRPDVPTKRPAPAGCTAPDPPLCERYIEYKRQYCTNEWVTKRCKYLCGLCGNRRVTGRPTIALTHATTTTTTTTTKRVPPGCATPDPKFCGKYVDRKKAYCEQPWVQKRCGHLCDQCDTNTTSPPTNATECELSDLKVCAKYERTKSHYCMNEWVQKNCRNLCGLCDNDRTTIRPTRPTRATRRRPVGCGYSDPQYCGKYISRKKLYCMSSWVQKRCKNLCGLCGNKSVTSRPTRRPRVTSSRKAPLGCGYSDPRYCWKYEARKKHYCRNTWVRKRCKNLCQLCGTKPVVNTK